MVYCCPNFQKASVTASDFLFLSLERGLMDNLGLVSQHSIVIIDRHARTLISN